MMSREVNKSRPLPVVNVDELSARMNRLKGLDVGNSDVSEVTTNEFVGNTSRLMNLEGGAT